MNLTQVDAQGIDSDAPFALPLPGGTVAILLGACTLAAPAGSTGSSGSPAAIAGAIIGVLVVVALVAVMQRKTLKSRAVRLKNEDAAAVARVPEPVRKFCQDNPGFDPSQAGPGIASVISEAVVGRYARAIADFTPTAGANGQIALKKGEQYLIKDDSKAWWTLQSKANPRVQGLAPSNYLQPVAAVSNDGLIAWEDLELGALLGKGAYGAVHRAVWQGTSVAVKLLRAMGEEGEAEAKEFANEAKQLTRLQHEHVVRAYGTGVQTLEEGAGTMPFLVTELLPGGTLRAFLHSDVPLTAADKHALAHDVARGMGYMHNRGVMHRDLKSDNVMIAVGASGRRIAKVADLGTAVRIERPGVTLVPPSVLRETIEAGSMTRTLGAGTPLWMAPEVLDGKHGKAKYGPSADVYSFGIVLWEISERKDPYEGVEFKSNFAMMQQIADGRRPDFSSGADEAPAWYRSLAVKCWAGAPAARPGFPVVLSTFEARAPESAYAAAATYARVNGDAAPIYEEGTTQDLTAFAV